MPVTAAGDFTGNGWSDLITRQTSTGSLYLYPGNGTAFGSAVRFGGGWTAMSSIVRFGDFNRDGHEDIVLLRARLASWGSTAAPASASHRASRSASVEQHA